MAPPPLTLLLGYLETPKLIPNLFYRSMAHISNFKSLTHWEGQLGPDMSQSRHSRASALTALTS